ncbi:hypothetical protein [Chloroflexus aggregans]|uniref:Uncharacterized protein n=1 Tax=Chloroflexus aggregans (strain MD-66 / DSM 9485) TaxID=326427 RepID=B8GB53_CHLAD|nr:hypothetical protein [Chloroflexus aggregans]ACL26653.1 conserved hypothetical protein [Chloroflexus aggregans DSM 9485]
MNTNIDEVLLSSSVTVKKYRELEKAQDREGIANFILERFTERYITPIDSTDKKHGLCTSTDKEQKHGFCKSTDKNDKKHGFCTMAICCLMIEALESFWQGWEDTKGKSETAFHEFFQRCSRNNLALGAFKDVADDFYTGVRCGILHQAETTNGWRIRRKDLLYDPEQKIINATAFHRELQNALKAYCEELR